MSRKGIILKNVSLGIVYKILNMAIVFITIPILLNYLDKEFYGIWVTIFSIINIVFFVDIGIANGLKTKLTEAISRNNFTMAKTNISNAYLIISLLAVLLLLIGSTLIYFLDLQRVLNVDIQEYELKKIFFATLILIMIGFILNLYKSFYYAIQKSFNVELSLFLYQFIILILVIIFSEYTSKSLFSVAIIYGASNILVGIIFTLIFFSKHKNLRPSFKSIEISKMKTLIDLSAGFFIIQLCMIIIFASDNVLISNLLSPKEVAHYDVVLKLFRVTVIIAVIAQDPLWPLYTEAYHKKDFSWIKQTIIRLNKLFIPFLVLIVVLVLIAKPLIRIWIPQELQISNTLIVFMGMFVLFRVYGIIYMYFLNAIGNIRLQVMLFVLGAILNIPLSIYFVKTWHLGTSGIILGTIISISALSIVLPIQTFKLLKGK